MKRRCGGSRLVGASILLFGCANPRSASEPLINSVDLDAPGCHEGGPSLEILGVQRLPCGKGDTCTFLDERIRNPEDRALWLLVDDARDGFAGYLDSVSIAHARYRQSPPVWVFSGQSYHLAWRVPLGADISVRNVRYFGEVSELHAVFFDRIALNYDRRIGARDPEGIMPARGDFDMEWMSGPGYDVKELFPLEGKERVSLDTWCAVTVPIADESPGGLSAVEGTVSW